METGVNAPQRTYLWRHNYAKFALGGHFEHDVL